MPSTVDYLNANADWRFVIADVRGADGAPFDLAGFTASVTFRPYVDQSIDIQDAGCAIAPGVVANSSASPPVVATGPTITVTAPVSARSWRPTRPTLVVGDVMISKDGVAEDEVKRLAFVAMPGTT